MEHSPAPIEKSHIFGQKVFSLRLPLHDTVLWTQNDPRIIWIHACPTEHYSLASTFVGKYAPEQPINSTHKQNISIQCIYSLHMMWPKCMDIISHIYIYIYLSYMYHCITFILDYDYIYGSKTTAILYLIRHYIIICQ